MCAGGFPGNPGGLVVSIVKTAGGRAPAHHARGRGRRTWRPTERSRRCSDGTAGRRQRSVGGWAARSRRVSEYRRSGGIEPTRPRGGKGAPAGGTVGGKDGQHTAVGSRLHVTTPDSRTGQTRRRDGGGHRLASWTRGGTRRRVAKLSVEEPDAAEPARPDLWGARVSNDPGLPDPETVAGSATPCSRSWLPFVGPAKGRRRRPRAPGR